MLSKRNIYLIILATVIFAGLSGFYYYRYYSKNKSVKLAEKQEEAVLTGPNGEKITVSGLGKGKIEIVPIGDSVPVPSLDRPISFPAGMAEDAKVALKIQIDTLTTGLKKNQNDPALWIKLGMDRQIITDYEGARLAFEYAASISSSPVMAYADLSELYHYYIKDYPKAESYLNKLITIDPHDISSYHALYDLYTLSYKEKIGQIPIVLKKGISDNLGDTPGSYELNMLIATYYRDAGDKANAIKYYTQAMNIALKINNKTGAEEMNAQIIKLGRLDSGGQVPSSQSNSAN